MNEKKCKALRREVKGLVSRLAETGSAPPADGLVYKDTQKVIGWSFPKEWNKDNFMRLAISGGPWLAQALQQAQKVFARQAINTPGSARALYRRTKAVLA